MYPVSAAAEATGRNYVDTGFSVAESYLLFSECGTGSASLLSTAADRRSRAERQMSMSNQVRGQTPGTEAGQPLPTTGTTESSIGPLAFEVGYPTDATVTKLEKPNVVLELADNVGYGVVVASPMPSQRLLPRCPFN